MHILEESIRRLTISMVPGLDPIRVALEDIEPGKGRISIECYGKAWACYWGAMGNYTIAEFFAKCSVSYLSGKLSDIESTVFDPEYLSTFLKKDLIKQRRNRELSKADARDIFDEIETIDETHTVSSLWHTHFDVMVKLLGDDWYSGGCLPVKSNPEYEYLCKIIRTVQAALIAKVIA